LLDEVRALALKIASKPAQTLRLSKRLLQEGQHSRLSDILELSAAYQALAHETEDHAEALDAFFEKRPPSFKGR
jgi:enoyl-CoA hydratase/carnithine racemase